jgi:imidazolonepropionase-like amidohydrolase
MLADCNRLADFASCRARSEEASVTSSLTVTNARIFDGASADLIEGDVRIEDGVIVEVGRGLRAGENVLDAAGRVVTPGFIDNHFHAYGISLNMLQMEATRKSYVAIVGSRRLHSALSRGFTTVRDVAGGDIGLSRAIKEGVIAAPNYYFTGPALSQTGGHGDPRDPHLDLCCASSHGVEVVDGVDALRVAVRERLRTGAHAIKIMASGGVVSLTDPIRIPQYSAEEIQVVTQEAARRGSYVAAHAYSPEAIVHAVTNGVRSIEHGNLLDEETAAVMASHGAVLVPTLMTYLAMSERGRELGMSDIALDKNTQVLAAGKAAIELATAAGVLVGFGTDLMGDLESEQLRGLQVQHEVQGTLELLRSVTSRNAEILGVETVGGIGPGLNGDLVILEKNPFDHPETLWQASPDRLVVKAGRVVE